VVSLGLDKSPDASQRQSFLLHPSLSVLLFSVAKSEMDDGFSDGQLSEMGPLQTGIAYTG
jgi:hypothetical protein